MHRCHRQKVQLSRPLPGYTARNFQNIVSGQKQTLVRAGLYNNAVAAADHVENFFSCAARQVQQFVIITE